MALEGYYPSIFRVKLNQLELTSRGATGHSHAGQQDIYRIIARHDFGEEVMGEGIAHPPPRRVPRAHLPGIAFIVLYSFIHLFIHSCMLGFVIHYLLIYLFLDLLIHFIFY